MPDATSSHTALIMRALTLGIGRYWPDDLTRVLHWLSRDTNALRALKSRELVIQRLDTKQFCLTQATPEQRRQLEETHG
jgi:hypothetical protein